MLYCLEFIHSFVNWLTTYRGYFASLATQFDITLLCCISMFDYGVRVVSNKTSLHYK